MVSSATAASASCASTAARFVLQHGGKDRLVLRIHITARKRAARAELAVALLA